MESEVGRSSGDALLAQGKGSWGGRQERALRRDEHCYRDPAFISQPPLVEPGTVTAVPIYYFPHDVVASSHVKEGEGGGPAPPGVLPHPLHGQAVDERRHSQPQADVCACRDNLTESEILHSTLHQSSAFPPPASKLASVDTMFQPKNRRNSPKTTSPKARPRIESVNCEELASAARRGSQRLHARRGSQDQSSYKRHAERSVTTFDDRVIHPCTAAQRDEKGDSTIAARRVATQRCNMLMRVESSISWPKPAALAP